MTIQRKIRLNPAAAVIDGCGGVAEVSKVTGVDRTQVWRWTQPKEAGGTGGLVPSEHQDDLLSYAKKKKLPLTAEMFFRSAFSDVSGVPKACVGT